MQPKPKPPQKDPATNEYWYRGKWWSDAGEVWKKYEDDCDAYDVYADDEYHRRKEEE